MPNLVESLSNLYTMMETRVGVFGRLCKLQGRLDLVLSQVRCVYCKVHSAVLIETYLQVEVKQQQQQLKTQKL